MRISVPVAAALVVLSLSPLANATPVVVTGDPVAPVPTVPGVGLCVTSRVSQTPSTDFPQSAGAYSAGINTFIDNPNGADSGTSVLTTLFDLSNNQDTGPKISWGDFTNAVSTCETGGCPFFVNDTTTSFASRFRGFLAVNGSEAGSPIHLGVYVDDAASVTVFDAAGNAHAILTQPPVLGSATWRATNTVTFTKPGLYPLEILYAQLVEHAALEVSTFPGTFTDFQVPADQTPVTSLSDAGFTLVSPTAFYQTVSGETAAADPTVCIQCPRGAGVEDAGVSDAGVAGCAAGTYCNPAALCVRCDDATHCGPNCAPCGGGESCVSGQCAALSVDAGTDAEAIDASVDGSAATPDASSLSDASIPWVDSGVAMRDASAVTDARAASPDTGVSAGVASGAGCGCRSASGAGGGGATVAGFALLALLYRRGRRARSDLGVECTAHRSGQAIR